MPNKRQVESIPTEDITTIKDFLLKADNSFDKSLKKTKCTIIKVGHETTAAEKTTKNQNRKSCENSIKWLYSVIKKTVKKNDAHKILVNQNLTG